MENKMQVEKVSKIVSIAGAVPVIYFAAKDQYAIFKSSRNHCDAEKREVSEASANKSWECHVKVGDAFFCYIPFLLMLVLLALPKKWYMKLLSVLIVCPLSYYLYYSSLNETSNPFHGFSEQILFGHLFASIFILLLIIINVLCIAESFITRKRRKKNHAGA
jgi:hypothetical protein